MRSRRISFALPIAIGLSIVLATGVAASSWTAPVVVASQVDSRVDLGGGVLGLDASHAVVAYVDSNDVVVHHSSDAGLTWSDRRTLPGGRDEMDFLAISGRGQFVDLAWETFSTRAPYLHEVRYARSHDFGATFSKPVVLARLYAGDITGPRIAHGPNGVVAVVWRTWRESSAFPRNVYVRVSTDDGVSFGKAQAIWEGSDYGHVAVAVAEGLIYVAFTSTTDSVDGVDAVGIRRSLDNGRTWSDVVSLARAGRGLTYDILLTAEGDQAVITFERSSTYYRRTTNGGVTWGGLTRFPRRCGEVRISLDSGVVRAAYVCRGSVYYSQTSDGVNWSARERLASPDSTVLGIGWAGRAIVGYWTYEWYGTFVEVRTRTP